MTGPTLPRGSRSRARLSDLLREVSLILQPYSIDLSFREGLISPSVSALVSGRQRWSPSVVVRSRYLSPAQVSVVRYWVSGPVCPVLILTAFSH